MRAHPLALGGMLTALATVVLLLGGLIPMATYCCPMLAMLILLPVEEECGPRMALAAYGAVSVLALLLVPDRELSLFYVFFGCYPILRPALQRISSRILRLSAKLLLGNLLILALYAFLVFVFQLQAIVEEFSAYSPWFFLVLLALFNVSFLLLDVLLGRLSLLWQRKLRRYFMKPR